MTLKSEAPPLLHAQELTPVEGRILLEIRKLRQRGIHGKVEITIREGRLTVLLVESTLLQE